MGYTRWYIIMKKKLYNVEKFDKHQKLVSENLKELNSESCVFDGYEIHEQLVTWALSNISTKKLKELIKRS
jgi:hypothetical protein